MATLAEKIAAERALRDMLEQNGLPQPDEVEYGHTCVRLFWRETMHCVIVQIDEPPPGWALPEDMTDEEREELLACWEEELDPSEMPFARFGFDPN
jgi:hypothetical protein